MRDVTEIRIDEQGDETHESWIKLVTTKPSATPGVRLFDSEIPHTHFISVRVQRCSRRRQLNGDWLHATQVLMEFRMSQAQWGAFVSSFGDGGGVPATLEWFGGDVPRAPVESRLGESAREVREAGAKALEEIRLAQADLEAAFASGGKAGIRDAIRAMRNRVENAPGNMKFAADQLTEHTENVVTKARADIEAMVRDSHTQLGSGEAPEMPLLGTAEEETS